MKKKGTRRHPRTWAGGGCGGGRVVVIDVDGSRGLFGRRVGLVERRRDMVELWVVVVRDQLAKLDRYLGRKVECVNVEELFTHYGRAIFLLPFLFSKCEKTKRKLPMWRIVCIPQKKTPK